MTLSPKFLVILFLTLALFSVSAFAGDLTKTKNAVVEKTENVESEVLSKVAGKSVNETASNNLKNPQLEAQDPDLQLSIEELREKYPIGWFDEKFGFYPDCETSDLPDYIDNKDVPRLVCGFTIDPAKVESYTILLNPLTQFTEAQLKSIILHYNAKYSSDIRVDDILAIILELLNNQNNEVQIESKIRSFLFSDRVLNSYDSLYCDALLKFDINNKHHDRLAVGYFRKKYTRSSRVSLRRLKESITRCVNKDRIDIIIDEVSQEFKSKIKE